MRASILRNANWLAAAARGQAALTVLHPTVVRFRSVEQRNQRTGVQQNDVHRRQLRWRICFRQGSFSQCFGEPAMLPTK